MQLDDLYRELIMEHSQEPRNFGQLSEASTRVGLNNPTCGDTIDLHLLVQDGIVQDVRFSGHGCAISMSAASMMTEAIKGKTVEKALGVARAFKGMLRGEGTDEDLLGDLTVMEGISKLPMRVKCATLGFNALEKGLASPPTPPVR